MRARTALFALALVAAAGVARARDVEDPAAAAAAALEGFRDAGLAERRERARRIARDGEAECVAGALALLDASDEPDAEVRLALVEFLARADLGETAAERRARSLGDVALADPAPRVVSGAIEGLSDLRHPAAGNALDRLVDELAGAPRVAAAEALSATAAGRAAIVRRVRAFAAGTVIPQSDVLGKLLEAYGRAVVDLPGGGEEVADVAPLLSGLRHPDDVVRLGAVLGIENLVSRCTQLLAFERCTRVLQALEDGGFPARDLDYRRALVALRFGEDPAAAIPAARRLVPRAEDPSDRRARMNRFYGLYFEAVALAASGRASQALPLLEAAGAVVSELARERVDLEPLPRSPSDRRRREAVDQARSLALVELQSAVALVLAGRPADDALVLARLRATHVRLLEAQILAERWGVPLACDIDALLDHDLGPRPLFYENTSNPDLPREAGMELLRSIGRGWASLAPAEMPGFEPFPAQAPALTDPLRDEERFRLMLRLELARTARLIEEAQGDPDLSNQERMRLFVQRQLSDQDLRRAEREVTDGAERSDAYRFLLERRDPSRLALWLARDLRVEGRAVECRELTLRLRDDLEQSGLGDAWLDADIGMTLASSYTEERRPLEAERVLLDVLADLEALVNQIEDARDRAREGDDSSTAGRAEVQIRQTELRIADCLVSLAVNANVRMNDQEKALGYFDRAFELDRRDFMRVLSACYRARAGRVQEARAELREVAPAPELYYNMACTFALLGEPDLAIDFLQRDFEENLQSRGALERQKAWAASDPDLESLRDDPRFQRLVE